MGMAAGNGLMKAGVTNVMNGLEEGRIDQKGLAEVALGGVISYFSGKGMAYNFKGMLSTGDNLARSSRIAETASETMAGGKGSKGSTNAAEPPSAYGKGRDIETNGFGPDTIINRNANYGAKAAAPSYGVSNKPIGDYQLGTNTPSRSNYVTGTNRIGMAAGAEEKIWLKAGDGTGVTGTPRRKVAGSLGSTGLDVGKTKALDVPGIAGSGRQSSDNISWLAKGNGKVDWKSVPNFGHTFTTHGAGAKNTQALLDRARTPNSLGECIPQGQWLNNQAAAEYLNSYGKIEYSNPPIEIPIPEGLAQIIHPDGTITSATRARIVINKSTGKIRSAIPIE